MTERKRVSRRSVRRRKMQALDLQELIGSDPELLTLAEEQEAVIDAAALVRTLREAAGLSQRDLAKRAGTTQAHVSAVERAIGAQGPTVNILARLVSACGEKLALVPASKPSDLKVNETPDLSIGTNTDLSDDQYQQGSYEAHFEVAALKEDDQFDVSIKRARFRRKAKVSAIDYANAILPGLWVLNREGRLVEAKVILPGVKVLDREGRVVEAKVVTAGRFVTQVAGQVAAGAFSPAKIKVSRGRYKQEVKLSSFMRSK